MTLRAILAALFLATALAACEPAMQASPPPPKPVAAPRPAAPARVGTMICRSSVDGRPAKCGAPNAVMVGIKFD